MLMVVLLALFLQTVLGEQIFIGHAVVVGFFLLIPTLYSNGDSRIGCTCMARLRRVYHIRI